MSRLAALRKSRKDEDFEPAMPPIEAGHYLLAYLWEVGPVMPGGMSAGPLTHAEILAWSALVGVVLQPWEARCLRRLSVEYLNESQNATKRGAPAPWEEAADQVEKAVEANATKSAIRALTTL